MPSAGCTVDATIKKQGLVDEKKQRWRLKHSKPIVDAFFGWCEQQLLNKELLPDNPLMKAVGYVRNRETELKVYLEDPIVPMDTNHIERALRPIPLGRKNGNFCWTELGAEHVGIIQSLNLGCGKKGLQDHQCVQICKGESRTV
jgi:transposase